MFCLTFFCFFLVLILTIVQAEIHDPLNIFCGSLNCYDVLGVGRNSTVKDIKKVEIKTKK